MRLALSNIAWDIAEDGAVAKLLHHYNIDAIDVVPGKYFPNLFDTADAEILQIKNVWLDRGIEITGMQALLFGSNGFNVFGSETTRNAMLAHLAAVCRIGGELGAKRLVFGSPKNRDCSGLSQTETEQIAVAFFRRLGDIARSQQVIVCLEPNPSCYGANFMTTSTETLHICQLVDHPAIKMQLDTGAMAINQENPHIVLQNSATMIGHVHASEPNLLPLGDGGTDHAAVCSALHQYLPDALVSIEMLATKEEPHLQAIERAIVTACRYYRDSNHLA